MRDERISCMGMAWLLFAYIYDERESKRLLGFGKIFENFGAFADRSEGSRPLTGV
jgi:hypothetical protein